MHTMPRTPARNAALGAVLALPLALIALYATPPGDMTDLEAYVADVSTRPGTPVAKLPAVGYSAPHRYASGEQRDPFEPLFRPAREVEDPDRFGPAPVPPHAPEALEAFPLDALRMVGTLGASGDRQGLVRDPDGIVHRVRPGHYLGFNYGKVVAVDETGLEIAEVVLDPATGWRERIARLALVE